MRRARRAALAVSIASLVHAAQVFAAACSEADVRVMQKEGLSKSAIDRICTSAPPKPSVGPKAAAERASNRCQTFIGSCFIAQTAPAGAACWCASPNGPVTGKVQP